MGVLKGRCEPKCTQQKLSPNPTPHPNKQLSPTIVKTFRNITAFSTPITLTCRYPLNCVCENVRRKQESRECLLCAGSLSFQCDNNQCLIFANSQTEWGKVVEIDELIIIELTAYTVISVGYFRS